MKDMNKKFWLALVGVLALGTAATLFFKQKNAQAAAAGYEIGATVADFQLKNVDGNKISLANFKSQKGVIVVFTCNHCPFAKAYEDRVLALDKKYAALGYPVLAINYWRADRSAIWRQSRQYFHRIGFVSWSGNSRLARTTAVQINLNFFSS